MSTGKRTLLLLSAVVLSPLLSSCGAVLQNAISPQATPTATDMSSPTPQSLPKQSSAAAESGRQSGTQSKLPGAVPAVSAAVPPSQQTAQQQSTPQQAAMGQTATRPATLQQNGPQQAIPPQAEPLQTAAQQVTATQPIAPQQTTSQEIAPQQTAAPIPEQQVLAQPPTQPSVQEPAAPSVQQPAAPTAQQPAAPTAQQQSEPPQQAAQTAPLPERSASAVASTPAASSSCQLGDPRSQETSLLPLAVVLQTQGLPRRASESSDEFELRAERVLAEAKKVTQGDLFKFSIPIPADQIKVDGGSLTIRPNSLTGGLLPTAAANGNYVIVSRYVKNTGQTSSETTFAGTRTIEKDDELILAVRVRGGDYVRWPKGFKQLTIPIDREKGKAFKTKKSTAPELAVLFAARLQSPYLIQEVSHQSPRPDFPHDVTSQMTVIVLELACAAIVDRSKNNTLAPLAISR